MPNAPAIQRLEHRLLELGCPAGRTRDKLREIADHHEDLKLQALTEGLSEAAAECRADRMLGEPITLADGLASMLRQSSWLGRHRVIGFCLLPPLATFAASLVALLGSFGLLRLFFSANQWAILAEGGKEFQIINQAVQVACYAVAASVAVLFCWLARRSIAGLGWAILACALCSLQGYFGYYNISPHAVRLGYSVAPNWTAAVITLAVALGAFALHHGLKRRARASVLLVGEAQPDWGSKASPLCLDLERAEWKHVVVCPTYWAVGIGLLLMLLFVVREFRAGRVAPARKATLLAARAGATEQGGLTPEGQRRGTIPTAARFKTIELRAFVNTPLVEWVGSPLPWTIMALGEADRHQTELPSVTHFIGGVPFNIQGQIQLRGSSFANSDRTLPRRVQGIQIGRKCERFHVLHGAVFSTRVGDTGAPVEIAALLVHYSDGSSKEVGIFSGGRLLNWVGPVPQSYVAATYSPTAAIEIEPAGVDEDPNLRLQRPERSLRLYKVPSTTLNHSFRLSASTTFPC